MESIFSFGRVGSSNDSVGSCPEEFRCPIGLTKMKDPVLTEDGFRYERCSIEEWLRVSSRSPCSNLMLKNKNLTPDTQLERDIRSYDNAGTAAEKKIILERVKIRTQQPDKECKESQVAPIAQNGQTRTKKILTYILQIPLRILEWEQQQAAKRAQKKSIKLALKTALEQSGALRHEMCFKRSCLEIIRAFHPDDRDKLTQATLEYNRALLAHNLAEEQVFWLRAMMN